MIKAAHRILLFSAVAGLVFGSLFTQAGLSLPAKLPALHPRIAHVTAAEVQPIYLPLVFNGRALPTIFGTAMVFNTDGGMNEMTTARNYWLRNDVVYWSEVEPTKGTRD